MPRVLSKIIPLAQWSNGLALADFAGHCAVEMKRGSSFFKHSWVARAECYGAESCWNVQGLWSKYCMPKASMDPLEYFRDNIRHLF